MQSETKQAWCLLAIYLRLQSNQCTEVSEILARLLRFSNYGRWTSIQGVEAIASFELPDW